MDTPSESIQDLSPNDEFEWQLALMDTFRLTEDELMVCLKIDPSQWAGEFCGSIDEAAVKARVIHECALQSKSLGFPCDPKQHQRPHDMINMFPLVLSPDWYDTPKEFEFVVWLFKVWNIKVREIAGNSENIKAAMRRIRTMSIWVAYYFGDEDYYARCCKLKQSINMINDLRYMHGCLDLEHDILIDRETPVIRELKDKWGLE